MVDDLDANTIDACKRVQAVLNDRSGFHLNDLDEATRADLLLDIVRAARGPMEPVQMHLGPRSRIGKLEAALAEALDGWDARERDVWESTGGGAYGPFLVDPRSAELRKLVPR